MNSERSRGANGRFVRCSASAGGASSEKHRTRQRKFMARRAREKKRIMSTYLAAFVIKGQNKDEHWIPGFKNDSLLLDLMESLIKSKFLEARGSRLRTAKDQFFKCGPNEATKRLPRIRAYPAGQSEDAKERVAAFKGWRFPSPTDPFEMEKVENWLQMHESKLRVSISESKTICFNMFSRYLVTRKRYMYTGYPVSNTQEHRSAPSGLANDGICNAAEHDTAPGSSVDSSAMIQSSLASPIVQASEAQQISQHTLLAGSRGLMKVASTDFYYRSLLLILNPTCEVRLDAVCFAWMHQFKDGKPQEDWCGLMKDIFQYCRLVAERKTRIESFSTLKTDLMDQLRTFKIIRSSAGLPLFEGSSSLIEQAFERSKVSELQ